MTDERPQLTEKLKRYALEEAGFDAVGIASAELPEFYRASLERWVSDGFAGTMGYMEREPARRASPKALMPQARSVLSLVINYHHPEDPRPEGVPAGKVAQYAYGTDYHKIIEKKLKRLARFIEEELAPGAQTRIYVDTGPVLEKALAKESGLGFFGKNTNIITREFGSFVFLASILTDLDLVPDSPHVGSCGSCRLCIDACPTGALLGDYRLDARRCISYLTIEDREERQTPDRADLNRRSGDWIFGCDVCQTVCPYNFRAKTTRHPELYPQKRAGTWISLDEIDSISSEEDFVRRFQGSPVRRAKLAGLRRNAAVVRSNLSAGDLQKGQ